LYQKLTQIVVSRATTPKDQDEARRIYKDGEIRSIASAVLIYRSQKR